MNLEAGSLENVGGMLYLAHLADNRNSIRLVWGNHPNAFGLNNMLGNVWEWCGDWYHASYNGLLIDGTANTTIGEKNYRVLRGSSSGDLANFVRVSCRDQSGPINRDHAFGFRVLARVGTSR